MKVAILGTWHVHTKEYTTGVLNNRMRKSPSFGTTTQSAARSSPMK